MAAVQDVSINENKEDALSQLEQKVVKQLEFYFGDKNYPKDKFLRQKAEEDDGWVTFECLLTFSRLKSLTTSEEVLVKSIKKSNTKLLEISEDDKKVRRLKSIPIPENTIEARQASKAKTVYCKGFPKDTTLDELEDFFGGFGNVVYIMMRRIFQTKEFKGSVFVEFSNEDDAKKFIAEENTKFKEEDLVKMFKDAYYKEKDKERAHDKEDQKKRTAEDKMEKDGTKKQKEDVKEEKEESFPTGSVLYFKGVGEQTSREDLKELLGGHEEITWVDFARGDTEGYVRFASEGAAQRAVDAAKADNDGKICLRNVETEVRILEGEEETKYFEKIKEGKAQVRQKKAEKRGSSRRGRGGWGGRGRGGGRFARGKRSHEDEKPKSEEKGNVHIHFDDDDEPASKEAKVE